MLKKMLKTGKNLLAIFCSLFLFSGCSSWLRYQWEIAARTLPSNSKIIEINNSFIKYSIDERIYVAYYACDGYIYKIVLK